MTFLFGPYVQWAIMAPGFDRCGNSGPVGYLIKFGMGCCGGTLLLISPPSVFRRLSLGLRDGRVFAFMMN